MKWIFLLCLAMFIPALTALLRSQPRYIVHATFAMGAIFYFLDPLLFVAPVSWPAWPGPVKGVEVSLIDGIALAIILATRRGARTPAALKLGFGIYFLGIIVSTVTTVSQGLWPPMFYMVQVLRGVLVFVAVKRATEAYPSAPMVLIAGLSVGVFYNLVVAVRQSLAGAAQTGGAMGHQNTLGMTTHFVTMSAFALLLAGRRTLLAAAIVIAGAVIAQVGGSRATVGLFGLGIGIVTILSIRNRMTGRKAAFAAIAALTVVLSAPAMMWAVERRSAEARESSNREREAMIKAASMIIADHPLGIGANRYVTVANVGGYSARAGVAWNWANRSAPVHNAYYLVNAELGYLGLVGMIAVFGAIILEGLRALRRLGGERADLVAGLTASTVIVAAHHYYEWIYMTFYIHYITAMTMGALVGLTRGTERSSRTWPEQARTPALPLAREAEPTPIQTPVY